MAQSPLEKLASTPICAYIYKIVKGIDNNHARNSFDLVIL